MRRFFTLEMAIFAGMAVEGVWQAWRNHGKSQVELEAERKRTLRERYEAALQHYHEERRRRFKS